MSAVHLAREPGQESNQHAMTKVKFTPYTWITMCLRDMCQKKMGADAGLTCFCLVLYVLTMS